MGRRKKERDPAKEKRSVRLNKTLLDAVEEVLAQRGGNIVSFLELQLISFTRTKSVLGLEDTITFGKYTSVPVRHAIVHDLAYMYWLVVEQRSKKFKNEVYNEVLKLAHEEGMTDAISMASRAIPWMGDDF